MKCLVVTTHPLTDCLCMQLSAHVEHRLRLDGHEVIVEDLYATKFEPALKPLERESYYETRYNSSGIEGQAKRLRESELLVLVFPTWWFGFPAMLQGWFDRVWGPGIAFEHSADFGPIKPALLNLKKVLVVTTLGSPWWVDRWVMRQPLKRIVKLALLGACARKSELQFLSLYNSEKLDAKRIAAFKTKIDKSLKKWS